MVTKNKTSRLTGITMATYTEAVPFIRRLEPVQVEKKPFPIYKSEMFYLMITGIGKTNSAIGTSYLINKFNIKNMLNIGAAGSVKGNHSVGDIFQIDKCIEYNDRKDKKWKHKEYMPGVIDGFRNAVLSTHEKPVLRLEHRLEVSAHAGLVDMEGAPFIYACEVYSLNAHLFKIVTDTDKHNEISEIISNIKDTRDLLFEFIIDNIIVRLNGVQ